MNLTTVAIVTLAWRFVNFLAYHLIDYEPAFAETEVERFNPTDQLSGT